MPNSQVTKHVLAESIKALMEKKPLSKISIGDITEHCGINRQTFYYHFKDKYDLVNWIYRTDTEEYIVDFKDSSHCIEGLCKLCVYIQKNKKFYINALNTPGQNSFQEYLQEFIRNLVLSLINEIKGDKELSQEDIDFIADFYTFAVVGFIIQGAKKGLTESPEKKIARIKNILDLDILKEISKDMVSK